MVLRSAITCIILLILLCVWSHVMNPFYDLDHILDNPEQYDGQRVEGFTGWYAGKRTEGGFYLEKGERRVFVAVSSGPEPLGRSGRLEGVFHAPNRIDATRAQYRPDSERVVKIGLSLIPCVLIPLLLRLALRVDKSSRALRLRRPDDA